MFNYLEKLRRKPLSVRKRVAIYVASSITAVIVIVWLSTFNLGGEKIVNSDSLEKDLKPFQEIKASISVFFDSLKEIGKSVIGVASTSESK